MQTTDDYQDAFNENDVAIRESIVNLSDSETLKFPDLNSPHDYITLAIIPMIKRPSNSFGITFNNNYEH